MKFLIGFLLFMSLFFQNCSENVNFSERQNLTVSSSSDDLNRQLDEGEAEEDLIVIKDLCGSNTPIVEVKSFNFPKPNRTCDWEADGNLEKRNQYFQARIEQHRSLDLPAGAVICDANFDFARQDFLYDDHFIFLFNKKVIASSYDFSDKLSNGNFNLLNYDWIQIAGMFWEDSKEMIFCPQGSNGLNRCDFPGHDSQGEITLDYDPDFIKAIMSDGIPENHSFSMVSIGDNDGFDCEHSEVNFNVQISYIMPQDL